MKQYILKRLVISIVTIWLIATSSFFLLRALPGNPFTTQQMMSPEMLSKMMSYYGLDRPLMEQYVTFMKNLLHGDFGYSLKYVGKSVNGVIAQTFPVSAQLGLQSYAISFPVGILFGIIAARKRGKAIDYTLVGFSVLGVSIPVFILASLLQYVFAIRLGWFPVAQWKSFAYTILPTLTLAIGSIAGKTRTMRTLMLEVISEDYVKTAKAKGLSTSGLIFGHVLPNAAIPVITILGLQLGAVIGGALVTETVFAWPGVGRLLVQAVNYRDLAVVQTIVLIISASMILCNLLVDTAYGWLDPRIRSERTTN